MTTTDKHPAGGKTGLDKFGTMEKSSLHIFARSVPLDTDKSHHMVATDIVDEKTNNLYIHFFAHLVS